MSCNFVINYEGYQELKKNEDDLRQSVKTLEKKMQYFSERFGLESNLYELRNGPFQLKEGMSIDQMVSTLEKREKSIMEMAEKAKPDSRRLVPFHVDEDGHAHLIE